MPICCGPTACSPKFAGNGEETPDGAEARPATGSPTGGQCTGRRVSAGAGDWVASRRGVAILGAAAMAVCAAALWVATRIPAALRAATDIVGYPTYYDFDIGRYAALAALAVLGVPVLTLALVVAVRALWRSSGGFWSRTALRMPAAGRGAYDFAAGLTDAAVLGLLAGYAGAIGLGFGAGAAAAVAAVTAAALAFATGGDPQGLARVVAAAAPMGPALLAVASARTAVGIADTGEVVAYPWFPVWLAAALAIPGWILVLRLGPERAARPVAMLWAGLPLLWLLTAELPGAIGTLDLFHEGEMLVSAFAVLHGRLPWADLHMLHGPWFDAGRALVGMLVLEPSRWGAIAGLHLIVNPLHLAGLAALFAWLSGWRWPHAALATLLVACLDPLVHVRLILWAPLLTALALLLVRATAARAFVVVVLGALQAVLVPEAALGVIAVAATIVLHDAVAGEGPARLRFRRTILCALAAAPVAAAAAVALLASGAWSGFVHHLTVFARDHALAGGIPASRQLPMGDLRVLAAVVVAALLLAAAGGGWAVLARRRPDVRDWIVVAAALFTLLYLPKLVYRADGHVYHLLGAAAVLLGAVAMRLAAMAECMLPRPPGLPHPVAVAALLAVIAVGPSQLADGKAAMPARWGFGGPVADPETVSRRLHPKVPTAAENPLVGYARAGAVDTAMLDGWRLLLDGWVAPGRPVLDLTNRPALFHLLLGYPPTGRFFHVSMALRRESQREMVADLDRIRPDAVVMPTRRGWDGIPDTVRHYLVSRAVLERYVPTEAFADGVLYVPRGTELTHPSLYRAAVACDWGHAGGFLDLEPAAAPAADWPSSPAPGPETVVFRGWAAAAGAPAGRVVATLDGRLVADEVPDRPRPDVAAALGAPGALVSGFEMTVQVPRGTGRRIRLLADFAGGEMLPLEPAPGIGFDSVEPPAGATGGTLDSRDIVAYDGVRHLARLPVDEATRGRLRLVVSGGTPGRRYRLADRPPWALRDPGTLISFGSPRGGRVALPVGACPQWWAYGDRPLYLWSEDGAPIPGVDVAWEVAP